jgi:hypothetical protein
MPCKRCDGNDLWDDLMWWGCNTCGWDNGGVINNTLSTRDRFGPFTYSAKPVTDEKKQS